MRAHPELQNMSVIDKDHEDFEVYLSVRSVGLDLEVVRWRSSSEASSSRLVALLAPGVRVDAALQS